MLWQWLLTAITTGIVIWLLANYAAIHYGGNKKRVLLVFELIAQAALAALIFFSQGITIDVLQAMLVLMILLVAAYSDIKTREVDDYLSIMLLLVAFIDKDITQVPGILLSAALISIPSLFVCITLKGNGIGGADIKIMAACGAVLGLKRGWIGMIIGLSLAVIINKLIQINKKANKTEGFPMVPYLAVGFFSAFIFRR